MISSSGWYGIKMPHKILCKYICQSNSYLPGSYNGNVKLQFWNINKVIIPNLKFTKSPDSSMISVHQTQSSGLDASINFRLFQTITLLSRVQQNFLPLPLPSPKQEPYFATPHWCPYDCGFIFVACLLNSSLLFQCAYAWNSTYH